MKTKLFSLGVFGLLILAGTNAPAQFSVDWFTVDGGGGTSTGGVYSASGTIGQPDAAPAPMTGGSFSVTGGFWSIIAVQTPGAPLLTIARPAAGIVVVSWPTPSTGWNLQQSTNLNAVSWVTPAETIMDNGTNRFITVSPAGGTRFYRLSKP